MEKPKKSSFKPILQQNCCGQSLFSFELKSCPSCGRDSLDVTEHEANVGLPLPCSVLIKSTFGSFLNYQVGDLLHCGISDSQGAVLNFDHRGVMVDPPSMWNLVISLPIAKDNFDSFLISHTKNEKQRESQSRYHQIDNNCYDFVIRFLNHVSWNNKNNHTKLEFVEVFIGKLVAEFETFYTLHREIEKGKDVLRPHVGFSCQNCKITDLQPGNLFHCLECESLDLCSLCQNISSGEHKSSHKLFPVKSGVGWLCDVCDSVLLDGTLFSCVQCEDYALCPQCYKENKVNGKHELTHKTSKVILPNQLGRSKVLQKMK